MLPIVVIVIASLAGLVALLAVIGALLPRGHVAARGVILAVAPDAVWRAISDVEAYPRWRRGVTAVEAVAPAGFRERSSRGAILYEVTVSEPPVRRITRIADPTLPFGGRWIFELAPLGLGTRLTITEDGFVGNPVFRLLSRTVFSTTRTIEQFLRDLGAHLGAPVTVDPAPPSSQVA